MIYTSKYLLEGYVSIIPSAFLLCQEDTARDFCYVCDNTWFKIIIKYSVLFEIFPTSKDTYDPKNWV